MSLILDALSRAEEEKQRSAGDAPNLLSRNFVQPRHEPSSRSSLLILGATALLMLLAGSWYALRSDAPAKPVSDGGESSTASKDEKSKSPPNFAKQTNAPQTVAASQSKLSSKTPLVEKARNEAIAALYLEPQPKVAGDTTALAETVEIQSSVSESPDTAEPLLAAKAINVQGVLREVRVEASRDALASHPTPLLEQLSKQYRDRVPTLIYSRHDYGASGRSSVVINGAMLIPGQRTRGVEVLEILSDAVVLRFEGSDFRLRSLNSWVNL